MVITSNLDLNYKKMFFGFLILSLVGAVSGIFASEFAVLESQEVSIEQAVVVNGENSGTAQIDLSLPDGNLVGESNPVEKNYTMNVKTSSNLKTAFELSGDNRSKIVKHFTSNPSGESGFSVKIDSELLANKNSDYHLDFSSGNETLVLDNCCEGNITFKANFPINYNVSEPLSNSNMAVKIDANEAELQ